MALKQVGQINTKDEVLNRIQAELASKLNPVLTCPILNGTLVQASLLASGAVNVNHGLGRVPQGWIVVGIDAQATVWSSGSTNKTLTLLTSADAGVTLWVF